VEAFPDLAALSDADLKGLTEEKMAEERELILAHLAEIEPPLRATLALLEKVTKNPAEWERYRRQPDRLKQLLRTADVALFMAKRAGRNRVVAA